MQHATSPCIYVKVFLRTKNGKCPSNITKLTEFTSSLSATTANYGYC